MSFSSSQHRTRNYIQQLKGSFVFKILAIGSNFLAIPLMINYLGNIQYGIWSTLLSIASWIVLFDVGIGNGLRNKISESLAKEDSQEAQNYISVAYTIIGLISIVLFALFCTTSFLIPWQRVFNTTVLSNEELTHIVDVTAFFLLANFWLSLVNQVFNGLQKTFLVVLNQFISNFLALIFVYILYVFFDTSLLTLAFFYGLSLILSNVIISLWFYKNNRMLAPKIKFYQSNYARSIISLGLRFFIIQIAVIVIFTTDKILITQLLGPEYVTSYDVVFKLFSIVTIIHNILTAPLWSAYTDAYHRNDLAWIKNTMKNQLKLFGLIVCVVIMIGLLAKPVIALWIGKEFAVETTVIVAMMFFIVISTWNNIFAYFINAIEELKIQINTSLIAMILNVPLSIFCVEYLQLGVSGIVIGTCISLSFFSVLGSWQTWKILKGKD